MSSGLVRLVDRLGTYGLTVIVHHGGDDYTLYGSLSSVSVKKDQIVSKGQVIGTVGVTDPDMPPHLYFGVRPGGKAVDPLEWLRGR